jgi:hypothetical protein
MLQFVSSKLLELASLKTSKNFQPSSFQSHNVCHLCVLFFWWQVIKIWPAEDEGRRLGNSQVLDQ